MALAGHTPVIRPVLTIEACRASWPKTPVDWAFFLSSQAVRHCDAAGRAYLGTLSGSRFVAVGSATQARLAELGISSLSPIIESSEGIVSLLEELEESGEDLSGKTALIVAGEGGRQHLENHLSAVGCHVFKALVYRRVPASNGQVAPSNVDAILVASGDGFQVVRQLWCAADGRLDVPLAAPSERVAVTAEAAGFTQVTTSESARPEAMAECLAKMLE